MYEGTLDQSPYQRMTIVSDLVSANMMAYKLVDNDGYDLTPNRGFFYFALFDHPLSLLTLNSSSFRALSSFNITVSKKLFHLLKVCIQIRKILLRAQFLSFVENFK